MLTRKKSPKETTLEVNGHAFTHDELIRTARALARRGVSTLSEQSLIREAGRMREWPYGSRADVRVVQMAEAFTYQESPPREYGPSPFDENIEEAEKDVEAAVAIHDRAKTAYFDGEAEVQRLSGVVWIMDNAGVREVPGAADATPETIAAAQNRQPRLFEDWQRVGKEATRVRGVLTNLVIARQNWRVTEAVIQAGNGKKS